MDASARRLYCVGPVTSWGREFLDALSTAVPVAVAYEPSTQRFVDGATGTASGVFVEAGPDARGTLDQLRGSGRPMLLVCFGRAFTKDDYAYFSERRLYAALEAPVGDDRRTVEATRRLVGALDAVDRQQQRFHSMKRLLVDSSDASDPMVILHEMRTILSKVERSALEREWLADRAPGSGGDDKLFHESEEFGDALTTIHDLERTGALWVRGTLPGQEGKVEFLQGKIVAATAGEVRGMKALYRIFLWDEPRFLFHRIAAEDSVIEDRLNVSVNTLRLEGQDFRQRYQQIRRDVPPPEIKLEIESSALHVGTQLSPDDFSALASVVEFGTIRHVLDFNELPDVTIFEALIRLRKASLIRVVAA